MPLTELAAELALPAPADVAQVLVTGVAVRADIARPGDLFAALPGTRAHGADYVPVALARGVTAVLTDPAGAARAAVRDCPAPVLVHPEPRPVIGRLAARVYGDPSAHLSIIGVTGTSGKTTVSHFVDAGLRAAGRRSGLIGTVGTRIAGKALPGGLTTPDAPDLQALLATMREDDVTHVAMEVSSHALAQDRVAGVRFAVGAFTNLSHDHLDYHADMADYFAAKSRLFDGRAAVEVVCVDDEWGARLVGPDTVTVSTKREATWWASDRVTRSAGADGRQRFVAHGPRGTTEVALRLPGAFNIANALVAVACLDAVGVEPPVAAAALAEVAVPGRVQPIEAGQPFLAVVDYAHKPAAVAALLDSLRAQTSGRLIVVLGAGGDRDTAKRPLMGATAASRAELLVVTDDNPRGEDPATIRAAVLAGARDAPGRGEVIEVGDRRAAIAEAVRQARPGDVVVVAGKGHETGQVIAGVRYPFDDATELAAAIRGAAR